MLSCWGSHAGLCLDFNFSSGLRWPLVGTLSASEHRGQSLSIHPRRAIKVANLAVMTIVVLTTVKWPVRVAGMSKTSVKSIHASRFDSLEQEVFLNLWRTYDRLKGIEEQVFGEFDLSAQQYNALRLLGSAHPGAMQTLALGRRLISRAPDMTRLLDRLEQRGLLARKRRSDNRRVVEVNITAQGMELLDAIEGSVRDCHDRQLGHMDEKQLQRLALLLREARRPHENVENPSFVDD